MESIHRSESRFWVKPHHVNGVVQDIKKHLPSYILPGKKAIYEVSTIYLDSSNFETYRDRLTNLYNANIIRIRWYGNGIFDNSTVYVERKKCSERQSERLKERFSLNPMELEGFLHGNYSCEKVVQPGYLNESHTLEICSEIQKLIVNKRLFPRLYVSYKRQAFQIADDNSVRLTLDTQIEMKSAEGFPSLNPTDVVYQFPFAILELKFQNLEPVWFKEILQHNGIITTYPDFGKFIQGMAVVFHTDQRSLPLPSWPFLFDNKALID
jgi:SPX domain protein involved in polyphosphate accumulation